MIAKSALAMVALSSGVAVGAQVPLTQRFDSIIQTGMERERIPGAAYAIVLDGAVIALRGFGSTAAVGGVPVDPQRTLFGLSSTTKLFTALAAARLDADGVLDLDAPVATYLDPSLHERVRGVTLAMLLTHTAGYDDPTIGSSANSSGERLSLADYVGGQLSRSMLPPETATSYSNVGYALAGLILERAARSELEPLTERLVFQPFGMTRSSLRQPLPDSLERDRAKPYVGDDEISRIYFNDASASAAFGTVADMGRLLERLSAPRSPVEDSIVRLLTARRFQNHPALPGVSIGFREGDTQEPTFLHGGNWQDYSNILLWLPNKKAGFHVTFSSPSGARLTRDLSSAFLEGVNANGRRAPDGGQRPPDHRCESVAGTYRDTRMSRSTVARLGVLTGAVREVRVITRGTDATVGGVRYVLVTPSLYRAEDGRLIAFRCGADGIADYFFRGDLAATTYKRVRWFESRVLHGAVLGCLWLVTLVTLVTHGFRAIRKRDKDSAHKADSLRWWATGAVDVYMLAIGGMLVASDPWSFQYGLPAVIRLLLALSWLVLAFALAAAALQLRIVLNRNPRPNPSRTRSVLRALHALALIGLVAELAYWNLIPVRTVLF